MQDATINNALLALRVRIIRESRNGLEHVEALLRQRRVPMPPVMRAPRQAFKRRELRREIAAMLHDGPMTCRQLADRVQEAHGLTRRRARGMVDGTLARMRRAGWVTSTESLWALTSVNSALTTEGLVNHAASSSSPRQ